MSDFQFTEQAKHEYLTSFQYFLDMQTEFDDQIKEILVGELQNLLNSNDHYPSSGKIDLTQVDLNEDEDELVKLTSAEVEYELFFEDDVTLVFSSKLVYKPAIPGADEFIDESDLRRFDVPVGKYRFTYEDEAYKEL
jgi:hypothetical protein